MYLLLFYLIHLIYETSIKEFLGHSSLAATQVYTHNSIERLKTVYNNAHPRAKSGGKNGNYD